MQKQKHFWNKSNTNYIIFLNIREKINKNKNQWKRYYPMSECNTCITEPNLLHNGVNKMKWNEIKQNEMKWNEIYSF